MTYLRINLKTIGISVNTNWDSCLKTSWGVTNTPRDTLGPVFVASQCKLVSG